MEGGPLGWLHRPCSHEEGRFFGFWGPDGDLVVISGLLKRCSSSHAVVIRTGGEGGGSGRGWMADDGRHHIAIVLGLVRHFCLARFFFFIFVVFPSRISV